MWSFAKLFENPFLSGEGIYFSNSRALSSHHGEWLTFDPMLKWSPENLINNPTDMNGLKYVNGDPVNFVDPSGNNAIVISAKGILGKLIENPRKTFDIVEKSYEVGQVMFYDKSILESVFDLFTSRIGGIESLGGKYEVNLENDMIRRSAIEKSLVENDVDLSYEEFSRQLVNVDLTQANLTLATPEESPQLKQGN